VKITTEVTKGDVSAKKFYWQTILEKKAKQEQEQENLELEALSWLNSMDNVITKCPKCFYTEENPIKK
jgi:hypothetical protein